MAAKFVTFFRNWRELAALQGDDKQRLAFYEAIFDYAFEGKVPSETAVDDKVSRAARAAFLTVQPLIDKANRDSVNGGRGGRPPKSAKNAAFREEIGTETETPSKTPLSVSTETPLSETCETPAETSRAYKKNKKENINKKETTKEKPNGVVAAVGDGVSDSVSDSPNANGETETDERDSVSVLPSKEAVVSFCESVANIPAEFAASLYDELLTFGGADADGKPIGNWRRYFKAAWERERAAATAAALGVSRPGALSRGRGALSCAAGASRAAPAAPEPPPARITEEDL